MDNLDKKVFELFSGRVVPKGATKKIKNTDEFNVKVPGKGNCKLGNLSYKHTDLAMTTVDIQYDCILNDGKIIRGTAQFNANGIYDRYAIPKKYRIEYIGQSYAKDGHRKAQERLSNHSALQKVLIDNNYASEKREILLVLFGADISPTFTVDNGKGPLMTFMGDTKSHDYFNLLEACLINQFKPKYNKDFKKGIVPSLKHETYKDVLNEKYDNLFINVASLGSLSDYVFFTDCKSVEINHGILKEADRLYMNMNDATIINEDEFIYSFFGK